MPLTKTISEIMTKDVLHVQTSDTVKKADELMKEEDVRHIPVCNGDLYYGMLTERSVIEYTLRNIYDPRQNMGQDAFNTILDYENLVDRSEHVLFPDDSIGKAIEMMLQFKLDCLPVVDMDHKLVGIVSYIDILLFANQACKTEN